MKREKVVASDGQYFEWFIFCRHYNSLKTGNCLLLFVIVLVAATVELQMVNFSVVSRAKYFQKLFIISLTVKISVFQCLPWILSVAHM